MNEFLNSPGGLVATILAVGAAMNLVCSGLSKFFDFIKDKTENKVDDKLAMIFHRGADIAQDVVDFFSANRQHK